jgi:hypothetical protein
VSDTQTTQAPRAELAATQAIAFDFRPHGHAENIASIGSAVRNLSDAAEPIQVQRTELVTTQPTALELQSSESGANIPAIDNRVNGLADTAPPDRRSTRGIYSHAIASFTIRGIRINRVLLVCFRI